MHVNKTRTRRVVKCIVQYVQSVQCRRMHTLLLQIPACCWQQTLFFNNREFLQPHTQQLVHRSIVVAVITKVIVALIVIKVLALAVHVKGSTHAAVQAAVRANSRQAGRSVRAPASCGV